MPVSQEILSMIERGERDLANNAPKLDEEVALAVKQADEHAKARRDLLREKYAWGLVAPLKGTRLDYAKKAIREVKDHSERQWLVEEVARIAKSQEWSQRKKYSESGYLGRLGSAAQKVGGAFAEGGTGMVEALDDLRKLAHGKGRSAEDVRFLQALEAAKRAENPFSSEAPGLAGKAATGAAGMAPDMAAGLLALQTGGPKAAFGYWGARMAPERIEGYKGMGVPAPVAGAAGIGTAAAEGAIELLNLDPTGLTKPVAEPAKKAIRQGVRSLLNRAIGEGAAKQGAKELVKKFGGEAVKNALKHPATKRGISAAGRAMERFVLEGVEEGLQAEVETGGQYLAAKAYEDIPDIPAKAIGEAGIEQGLGALPGLAVLSGAGGAVDVAQSVGQARTRVKRFAEGAEHAKVQSEIVAFADRGHTPSVAKWQEWGLKEEEGMNRKRRREATQELAEAYREIEQMRFAFSGVTPTAAQWKALGLPEEAGKTEADRKSYLAEKFLPESPRQAEAPVEEQPAALAGETQALEAKAARGVAPATHDFPVEMEGTGEQIGGREVVRQLEQIWGTPLRFGRLGKHKARGIYKLKSRVARLAKGEEASPAVQIHEAVGHHLDETTDILKSAPADAKQEVGKLDYDASKLRADEGFAEFVRAYLTGGTERFANGIDLKTEAPKFLSHFEGWLEEHPEVKAKMEASREPLLAFKQAGAVGRVKGQISKTGIDRGKAAPLRDRLNKWKEHLYARVKEEGRPVKRFVDEARQLGYDPEGETTPFEDYNALRQVGPHFAENAIEHGVFTLTGTPEKIGPSMYEALAEVEPGEDYENFIAWAYANHAIESWGEEKDPGITLADAKEVVSRLGNSRYESAAAKVTEFNNALINVLADAGVLDAEAAERIVASYETYIPLERAREGSRGGGGRRMLDLSSAIKGRRGSGLQIVDPIESTLARATRLYERAAQQLVINKLVQVAADVKGLGGWVEEVPPKVLATKFSFETIKPQLEGLDESLGIDVEHLLEDIDPETILTVWRPDLMKVHGVPIYRVTLDGESRFFQLDPDLGDALGGLETVQHLDPVTHIMRAVTGLMKRGATRLNPDFILSNAIRDCDAFLLQGEKGLKGAFDPAQYAAAYVFSEMQAMKGEKGVPEVELFKRMGGELSTYAGLDRLRLRRGARRAVHGRQGKLATTSNVVGVTEVAPRIAEFAAILEREGWLDRVRAGETPPMEVLIRAINAAHDVTIDFRRMGKWGRYINYYVPFFNARVEGLDKFVRTFKDHPGRSTFRAMKYIVLRSFIYWWLRHDDDDYKERPAWQDNFYIFKDGEGNPVWRVPKPQEWGLIGSGIERMLDAMYERDPEPVARWFGQVFSTINPGVFPAGVTPLAESLANYDFSFRHREIESRSLRRLEAPDRYYDHTTGVSKAVARLLHKVSGGSIKFGPAKIDHLADGLLGGLYGKINAPFDKLYRGGEWSASDIPGLKGLTLRQDYARSIDDFYSRKESLSKIAESKKLRGEIDEEHAAEFRRIQYAESLMSDIRKAIKGLPAKERREGRLAMIGLARAALGREPLERYPNPIANPDAVPAAARGALVKHISQKAITASGKLGVERTERAAEYLRAMEADRDVISSSVYDRLRVQGFRSTTARERQMRAISSL